MSARHTLLFRLVGPMQAWGYRSRFEERDTGLEPTRSGVLGLLASACGIERSDAATLAHWDDALRFGARSDQPRTYLGEPSGFRVETDFHTAQDVLRASGKGRAETVLSRRAYLTDARFTVGVEAADWELLQRLERGLKNPVWTLSLGRKSFPLSLPPWLPGGGLRENTGLLTALKSAPFPRLTPNERLPKQLFFVLERGPEETIPGHAIEKRSMDRPLDFAARRFGLRQAVHFALDQERCALKEEICFSQK